MDNSTENKQLLNLSIINRLKDYRDQIKTSEDFSCFIPQIDSLLHSADSPLLVMIMGEFKTGKSTLINALLEDEILKSGVTAATAVVTKLSYAPKKKLRVFFSDSEMEEYPVEKLAELTSEGDDSKREFRSKIKYVELQYPIELLKKINLIDTPGLNVDNELHIQATKDFMNNADAVFWVSMYGNAATSTEVSAIAELEEFLKPIVIVNQIEFHDDDEGPLEDELAEIKQRFGNNVKAVYGVSALLAKEAIKSNNEAMFEESRWNIFKEILETEIIIQAKKVKDESLQNRFIGLTESLSAKNKELAPELTEIQFKYSSKENFMSDTYERQQNLCSLAENFKVLDNKMSELSSRGAVFKGFVDIEGNLVGTDVSLEKLFGNVKIFRDFFGEERIEYIDFLRSKYPWIQEDFEFDSITFTLFFKDYSTSKSHFESFFFFYPLIQSLVSKCVHLKSFENLLQESELLVGLQYSLEKDWNRLGRKVKNLSSNLEELFEMVTRYRDELNTYNNRFFLSKIFSSEGERLDGVKSKIDVSADSLSLEEDDLETELESFFGKICRQNNEHFALLEKFGKVIINELKIIEIELENSSVEIERKQENVLERVKFLDTTANLLHLLGIEDCIDLNKNSSNQSSSDISNKGDSVFPAPDELIDLYPTIEIEHDPHSYLLKSKEAINSEEYRLALKYIEVALSRSPSNIDYIFVKIQIYGKIKEHIECEKLITKNIKAFYKKRTVEEFINTVLFTLKKNSNKSDEQIKKILSKKRIPVVTLEFVVKGLTNVSRETLLQQAEIFIQIDDCDNAFGCLHIINDKFYGNDSKFWYVKGKIYDQLKKYGKANKCYKKAQRLGDYLDITPFNSKREKYIKRRNTIYVITGVMAIIMAIFAFIIQYILFSTGVIQPITCTIPYDIPSEIYVSEEYCIVDSDQVEVRPFYAKVPQISVDVENSEIVYSSFGDGNENFITGISEGITTVNIMFDNNLYASQEIAVLEPQVTDFNANLKYELEVEDEVQLYIDIEMEYEGEFYPEIVYSSENPNVVTVDENGVVTAVGVGETNIVVSAGDQEEKIPISVKAKVNDIVVDEQQISVERGQTVPINPTVITQPDSQEFWPLEFTSSDPSIVAVDNAGNISGKEYGEAVITIESRSGVYEQINVSVVERVYESTDSDNDQESFEDFEITNLSAQMYYDYGMDYIEIYWECIFNPNASNSSTVDLIYSCNGGPPVVNRIDEEYGHFIIENPNPGDVYEITVKAVYCDSSQTITFNVPERY